MRTGIKMSGAVPKSGGGRKTIQGEYRVQRFRIEVLDVSLQLSELL